ncbi:MAG: DUF134 domain-containing protein [Kiritimatiellales bacterium]|nr:DUF134 domain-containing protein [Kiritimatiellales bacterium]
MPRPMKCRRVQEHPRTGCFKPAGIPGCELEEIIITVDELEAIRLADLEGHYHEEAAEQVGVSRQTFGNILKAAHAKVADCLVNGKMLKIEGGVIECVGRGRRKKCKGENQ